MSEHDESVERRFPRRFLLTAGAAAAAAGIAEVMAPAAEASSSGTPWVAGGNSGIRTSGSNFLGTRNVAPLVFKTAATNGHPVEHMRIAPTGYIGIGTHSPAVPLDVYAKGSKPTIRARYSGTNAAVAALSASSGKAPGVVSASVDNVGLIAKSTNSSGLTATGGPSGYGAACSGGYCGVRGEAQSYGGIFYGDASGSYGVYSSGLGVGTYGYGGTYGVRGVSAATGVHGSGPVGVEGVASSGGGKGVYGHGGSYGVYGADAGTAGVFGSSGYVGTWAEGASYGAFGHATGTSGTNYGVFGETSSPTGWAVYAQGNARVTGTLVKAAGSFKIDHPLAPDTRWLSHSFVESPDMMNVYNGNVVLNGDGKATVRLPDYFTALNKDFRYQLTPIGGPGAVYVASKITDNAFTIAGGTPGLEVSWQVTGIRNDDYARHHPIVVETDKAGEERGTRQFVAPGVKAIKMQVRPVPGQPPVAVKHAEVAPPPRA